MRCMAQESNFHSPMLASFRGGSVLVHDVTASLGGTLLGNTGSLLYLQGDDTKDKIEERIRELAGQQLIFRKALKRGLMMDLEERRRLAVFARNRVVQRYLERRLEQEPVFAELANIKSATETAQIFIDKVEEIARKARAEFQVDLSPLNQIGILEDNTVMLRVKKQEYLAGDLRVYELLRPALGPPVISGATPFEAFVTELALAYEATRDGIINEPDIRRDSLRETASSMTRFYFNEKAGKTPDPTEEEITAELNDNREGRLANWYHGEPQICYRAIQFPVELPNVDKSEAVADEQAGKLLEKAFAQAEEKAQRTYQMLKLGQSTKRLAEIFGKNKSLGKLDESGEPIWENQKDIEPRLSIALSHLEPGEVAPPYPLAEHGIVILELIGQRREPLPVDLSRQRAKEELFRKKRRIVEQEEIDSELTAANFRLEPNWWEIWKQALSGE